MKQFIYTALSVVLVSGAFLLGQNTTAQANLWTAFKNSGFEVMEPAATYRVEASGLDVRTYEWTPVSNPGYACVMSFGQTHPVGMFCFPKAETVE